MDNRLRHGMIFLSEGEILQRLENNWAVVVVKVKKNQMVYGNPVPLWWEEEKEELKIGAKMLHFSPIKVVKKEGPIVPY